MTHGLFSRYFLDKACILQKYTFAPEDSFAIRNNWMVTNCFPNLKTLLRYNVVLLPVLSDLMIIHVLVFLIK